MPVGILLATMTLRELVRWQAYFELQREHRDGVLSPEQQREQMRALRDRRRQARRDRLGDDG